MIHNRIDKKEEQHNWNYCINQRKTINWNADRNSQLRHGNLKKNEK